VTTVYLTNFELARVLGGDEMTCTADDGSKVVVALVDVDRLMASNVAAIAGLFPNGGGPAPMTREQAERLSRPVHVPGAS
jgi:hypothetical protein